MQVSRPIGLLAGFHASRSDEGVPELDCAGEQWALRSFPIRPHSHQGWELFYQVDGWSVWEDERGGLFRVDACGLMAMPPAHVHWLTQDPPGSAKQHFIFAVIDVAAVSERHPEIAPLWSERRPRFSPNGATAFAPLRQLIHEVSARHMLPSTGLRLAIDSAIVEATRIFADEQVGVSALNIHPAVERAMRLIELQCGRAWTLAELSAECGLSPNHLAEMFTRDVGTSPRQYLLRTRMDRAQALLSETDIGVSDLALELGFSSGQHFATTFKAHVGITPNQHRRASRGAS